MKKFTVLVALALLAATGTGYAVTCAYDNVPSATLLVPYFKVARNGATPDTGDIPFGGVNTIVAITNVSEWGVISHWTVWNKQSRPVVDWNVPLTGYDVAATNVRDILNGKLNYNTNTQVLINGLDPCVAPTKFGDTQTRYVRFTNPGSIQRGGSDDAEYSVYLVPAFDGAFRKKVWDSLDEGADYMEINTAPAADKDNPVCGVASTDGYSGDFTGYITIDVVNHCTQRFPDESRYYLNDTIATVGWDANGGANVLMGDVFFVDPATAGGNISGDAMLGLEFDTRLDWTQGEDKTFYARYDVTSGAEPTGINDVRNAGNFWDARFGFIGDGREPLGTEYGFRYLNDAPNGVQTWATIWRSDLWDTVIDAVGPVVRSHLCSLAYNSQPVIISVFDMDESLVQGPGPNPDPSGGEYIVENTYIWWESQRLIITGNTDLQPASYKGGWTDIYFPPTTYDQYNQAFIGIQHSAPGLNVSVGHNATLLDNQFLCPGTTIIGTVPGNIAYGSVTAE
jgi:hypothetical protein